MVRIDADRRDEVAGWSPPRCRRMGAAALLGIDAVLRDILAERG